MVVAENWKHPRKQFFIEWLVKQTKANPHHEILHSINKEKIIGSCVKLNETPENYVEWKNPKPRLHTSWLHLHNILEMIKL